ncbi:ABC transporter substrate-binding protein [Roseomonas haemaphysalidis]|uniref:Extracellular solute-binding protein n=1 Tax=Roseomonas haemaphysalidis TaxID=2768162 RepID=A0ABS3KKR7_9PROT|nr:extracellular solute-binding protein [Roseomonas haemaphysalidis]MBO1078058.1 extracellular solute-binding protein [Roseomonas haemaphysalidis]
MTAIDRRALLALSALGTLAAPRLARAQAAPLAVLSHRVHQTVATAAPGGDVTAPFSRASGAAVQWTTFDIGPLWDRLQREASLSEGNVDVGFVLNTQVTPRAAALFEPLDAWMARDPIEAPEDLFPGLVQGFRVGGAQVALPVRHSSSGLHYNAEILEKRGITEPPRTIEALEEVALRCSYREGGPPVVGLVIPGVAYANVIDIARAWNGDFITPDFRCVAAEPPMLNAIRLLRRLFEANAFPRTFSAIGTEDVNTWMQTGRAAMALTGMSRNRLYNDPSKGRFAGRIMTAAVPVSETLRGQFEVAPAKVEFWGMAIPRNARRKDLSWAFIKAMLTRQATLAMALGGNGPVRNSTYEDPQLKATIPYAEEERRVLRVARVPLPAFDEAARAGDLFKEEAEAAVLGMKTPEAAMRSLTERVAPLLPRP